MINNNITFCRSEERTKEIEMAMIQYLSYTDSKNVYFLANGAGIIINMMKKFTVQN